MRLFKTSDHPPLPSSHRPQYARVIFDFEEEDRRIHASEMGWAKIMGEWLLWLSEENGDRYWTSWPMSKVVCVEWRPND